MESIDFTNYYDAQESRLNPRWKVDIKLSGSSGESSIVGTVLNLSREGLLLETDGPLSEQDKLILDFPEIGSSGARVVWSSDRLRGCVFDTPLSTRDLSALRLRSLPKAPPASAAINKGVLNADEHFGTRLRSLRECRSMSRAQLARELGVSSATLSVWETGKGRPRPKRLALLAQTLGVSEASLTTEAPSDIEADPPEHRESHPEPDSWQLNSQPIAVGRRLPQLILASKTQIAELVGVSPDAIEIIIRA